MFKKLGFAALLISFSLAFTNVSANALPGGLGEKIQKKTKLEGKWKILAKPAKRRGQAEEPIYKQIGEIEFKKERDGKYSATIANTSGSLLPGDGTVNGIRYKDKESNLYFQIVYSENDRRVFTLKVDGADKFSGRWAWSGQGTLGEIRLEK